MLKFVKEGEVSVGVFENANLVAFADICSGGDLVPNSGTLTFEYDSGTFRVGHEESGFIPEMSIRVYAVPESGCLAMLVHGSDGYCGIDPEIHFVKQVPEDLHQWVVDRWNDDDAVRAGDVGKFFKA